MHIFDEIRVQNLERRQFQLTMLASMTIAVLATGVAIGRVEEVDARIQRLADELIRELRADLGDGGERSFARAKGHRAEREAGNN